MKIGTDGLAFGEEGRKCGKARNDDGDVHLNGSSVTKVLAHDEKENAPKR